jgi:hypothetical protein
MYIMSLTLHNKGAFMGTSTFCSWNRNLITHETVHCRVSLPSHDLSCEDMPSAYFCTYPAPVRS